MKKIKVYSNWGFDLDLYHEKQIELYIDSIPTDKTPHNVIRFVWLLEPPEIAKALLYGEINENIHHHQENFNYVFTYNDFVLEKLPGKSFMFEYGTTWIKDYRFPDKKFEVSTLVGGKRLTEGHSLRHKVWASENEIKNPTNFFLSGNFGGIENYNNNPTLGGDKSPLFDSQFHICIENTKRENWFTEKLIDCLQTKTVPIYYGCPNIDKWFDIRGFIIVDNLKDIINTCNEITPETYKKMLPYVEENYKRSHEFVDIRERLKKDILNIIQ